MRVSNLFGFTRFEKTSNLPAGLQRLQRAGYLRQLSPTEAYFPNSGMALLQRMEELLAEKLAKVNGQRIQHSFPDDFYPAFNIASRDLHSYRQLPAVLFSIQPRLFNDKELNYLWPFQQALTRMTAFLFAENESRLQEICSNLQQQLLDFFSDIAISPVPVILNPEQPASIELIVFHPEGNCILIQCPQCGYQAAQNQAQISKPAPAFEPPLPVEKVATPETKTIDALAKLLNLPESKTAKAVFRMAEIVEGEITVNRFVFAVVRGDMELNEFKLARAIGARYITLADESQILATGAVPGYASPIGLKNLMVVVDDLIPRVPIWPQERMKRDFICSIRTMAGIIRRLMWPTSSWPDRVIPVPFAPIDYRRIPSSLWPAFILLAKRC